MIVEMRIQNFFDDDLDSWVVGNCEEPNGVSCGFVFRHGGGC